MKKAGILSLVLLVGLGILSFIVIVGLSDRLVATQSALEFSVGVNERGTEIIEHAVAVAKTLNDELARERVIKETAMTEVEDLRAELRQETARKEVALTVLKLVKRDLESSLNEERRLSEEKLAALESQLKASTEESMRVEGRLVESLKKETSAKEATWAELQAAWQYLGLAQSREAQAVQREVEVRQNLDAAKNNYTNLYNSFQKTEALIERIESSSFVGSMDTGKVLKPVIFIPADIETPANINLDLLAVTKNLRVVQVWFQNQLGMTFNLQDPVVFRGSKTLKQYDGLTPGERISAIRNEIGGTEAVVVFLYGSNDSWSWGSSWKKFALIGSVYGYVINEGPIQRYIGSEIVAHELGHVFGLPHGEDRPDFIMAASFGRNFPYTKFTDQEKEILRRNLTN